MDWIGFMLEKAPKLTHKIETHQASHQIQVRPHTICCSAFSIEPNDFFSVFLPLFRIVTYIWFGWGKKRSIDIGIGKILNQVECFYLLTIVISSCNLGLIIYTHCNRRKITAKRQRIFAFENNSKCFTPSLGSSLDYINVYHIGTCDFFVAIYLHRARLHSISTLGHNTEAYTYSLIYVCTPTIIAYVDNLRESYLRCHVHIPYDAQAPFILQWWWWNCLLAYTPPTCSNTSSISSSSKHTHRKCFDVIFIHDEKLITKVLASNFFFVRCVFIYVKLCILCIVLTIRVYACVTRKK